MASTFKRQKRSTPAQEDYSSGEQLTSEQYAKDWENLRERYRTVKAAPVKVGLPFVIVWTLLRLAHDHFPDSFPIAYLLAHMEDVLLWIILPCTFGPVFYLRLFYCPRCHRRYFGGWRGTFDRRTKHDQETKCFHCGLHNTAWETL